MPIAQDDVLNALKQCYDPEIPVNIVDLGLIYEIRFDDVPEGQQDVTVNMTLTAQGCPEHVNISAQVKSRVEQLPGARNANPMLPTSTAAGRLPFNTNRAAVPADPTITARFQFSMSSPDAVA